MKTIGLLGGMSWESTAHYYRLINEAVRDRVGGLHSARSLAHLSRIVELANASLALEDPELARERWHGMLRLNGVDA